MNRVQRRQFLIAAGALLATPLAADGAVLKEIAFGNSMLPHRIV